VYSVVMIQSIVLNIFPASNVFSLFHNILKMHSGTQAGVNEFFI